MPRTILIVDDDRELCDLVAELLADEGFDVVAHHSGAGAIELAASGRYELVILDATRTATRNGEAVPLTSVEFDLLHMLLTSAGRATESLPTA